MSKVSVEKLGEEQLKKLGVYSWPIWQKEASKFDWFYDSEEKCYFLEGKVTVKTKDGNYEIQKGDFATFPPGLSCVWEIHEPVRKHYQL